MSCSNVAPALRYGDDDALADRLEQMLIGAQPQGASEQMLQENMEMPDFGGV